MLARNVNLKTRLTFHTGEFMAALLLIQPLLDVLSYFLQGSGATAVTTAVRMALLAVVCLYGFAISDRRQLYLAGWALMGGFWLLHMLNCVRVGYEHPVQDAAEYLKLLQFPLWTMAFITFFKKREGLDMQVLGILTINFAVILLVIGLSFLTGRPVYTYEYPERGVQIGLMGWFGVHSAQAAIVSLLVPPVLLWGLRTRNLPVFSLCVVGGLSLLYFTGTRLTYYVAVLIALAFLVLIFLCKQPLSFSLPLAAALVLLLVFRGSSPMEQRQKVTDTSFSVYQEQIDRVMGQDRDFQYREGEEIPPAVLKKIERVYTQIYGKQGVYGEVLLGDVLERFGTQRVLEKFQFSIRPQVLNNARIRKLNTLEMIWEDQDFLTHLLGFEYSQVRIGDSTYDPENDFPALLYYTGYLGTALYCLFLAGVALYAVLGFLRRFPSLLTAEFAVAAMVCALAVGAAQLSGSVLRRPSVTVYFSLAAAALVTQAREAPLVARLQNRFKPNPAVIIKKI